MKLKMYGYPKCSTCRAAAKSLQSKGHELDTTDVFDTPPSAKELGHIIKQSGLDMKKFFNTSGEVYREMGLKDKLASMTPAEQLKLLSTNGRLIKRPIVTDGTKVTVGYKEQQYEEIWG